MICFGWKGGMGTASRRVEGATVGVLVLANFGSPRDLRIDGVPVGRMLPAPPAGRRAAGSCIAVVATDAPLAAAQLERVARRAGLGLARTGSVAHHGSGEIFMAFGTGMRLDRDGKPDGTPVVTGRALDPLFAAVVEASEEAVLNSMFTAPTVVGRDGNTSETAHNDEVLGLLR
jgi:D-aminopeptidase